MSSDGCRGLPSDSGLFAIRADDGGIYGVEGTLREAQKEAEGKGLHGHITKAGQDETLATV